MAELRSNSVRRYTEAPVGENIEFIESCYAKHAPNVPMRLKGTPWGIMMAVNEQILPGALDSFKVHSEGPMKDRLATIELPDYHCLIGGLHAPHGDPLQAIPPMIDTMGDFWEKKIVDGVGNSSTLFFGDFNKNPRKTPQIPQAAETTLDRLIPSTIPLKCETYIQYPPKGHIKQGDIRKSVDCSSINTLSMTETALKETKAFFEQRAEAQVNPKHP